MPELRAIRLLNAIESGNVLGAELETYLSDDGRLAEFTVLLSQRSQAQRMANGQVTMDAIVLSLKAKNAIFVQATEGNSTAVEAVVKSAIAMNAVSNNVTSLEKVSDNPTSWSKFIASNYYESNIKDIVANYAGVDSSLYANITALIVDPTSFGDISVNARAMKAIVASLGTVDIMGGNSVAMSAVADNTVAIGIVASATDIMPTIASHTEAMNEIVSRSIATSLMSNNKGAIQAISKNSIAWSNYLGGTYFSSNLKNIVANIANLTPSDYANVDEIIASETALTAVSLNSQASQALASSSSAVLTLASSPNLSIILGSAIAMEFFGTESAITSFIGVTAAVPVVFTSAIAKSVIVASDALMNIIATTAAITDHLTTIATTALPTNLNSVGSNNVFGGFPDKFIVLKIRANNIGAIAMTFTLAGSPIAGSTYGNVVSASGTVTATAVFGLTNPATWKASGIAATAAASPEVTYVDMT